MEIDKMTFGKILSRLDKLERTVFATKIKKESTKAEKQSQPNFSGATGGIRLLQSEGFFAKKRSFKEIREGLASREYYYSRQAAQSALNNICKEKILANVEEKGQKMYANRK